MPHIVPRCPICCHAGWHDRADALECTHCGIALPAGIPTGSVRAQVLAALPTAGRDQARTETWRLSAHALRNAAWALGFSWRDGAWRPETAARPEGRLAVTLGVIGRRSDLPRIIRLAQDGGFARAVAVLDGDGPPPAGLPPGLRAVMRPLDGDFASQRNHLQALAGTGWVLQLDTDEVPSAALLDAIGWMVRAAGRDGIRAIGLPRRNLVGGVETALYPDIQYRLLRADIRFAGIVHERPVLPFAQTTLGLAGAIEHRLDPDRVRARSQAYEAMRAGGGRPSDEDALLQPFDPAGRLFR